MPDSTDASTVHFLAAAQHGVVSRAQALDCGLTDSAIRRLVARRRWRRLRPRVFYVQPGGDPPPLAARVMAVQLAYGPRAVAVGPTAARLWRFSGLPPAPGGDRLHVVLLGGGAPRGTGVRAYTWRLPPSEVTVCRGIRLTTPGRTLRDTVMLVDRHTAVSVIDSALQAGAVSAEELPDLCAANARRPGAARTRAWWALADPRAQSSLETRLRLVCHDAGIPPEDLQYPVYRSDGTLAGRADLAWPSRGVVVEADGRGPHSLPAALFTDRGRQNRILTAPGRLTLLRFTWSDLQRPKDIVAMIRQAGRDPAPGPAPPTPRSRRPPPRRSVRTRPTPAARSGRSRPPALRRPRRCRTTPRRPTAATGSATRRPAHAARRGPPRAGGTARPRPRRRP
ncbi:endonuclease domain-containing protein [Streptomonospora nanhaiensis]|uniref:endonuclease domain-containing protein n=1 Tax=Streptomonospora nanhaiensis TaxID=1323731 RepID=UPI0020CAF8EA|nr:endonuclease domain-containing protein [Streptomonospora nanhaiensis]